MTEKFYSLAEVAIHYGKTRQTIYNAMHKLKTPIRLDKVRDAETGKKYYTPETVERLAKLISGEIDNSFTDEKQQELDTLTSKVKELESQLNVKDECIKKQGEELEKVRSELEESKGLVKTLTNTNENLSESVRTLSETVKRYELKSIQVAQETPPPEQKALPPAQETREGILQRIKHFFLKDRTVNTFTSNDSVKDDK